MMIAKAELERFFAAYAKFYNDALAADVYAAEVAAIYSSSWIAVAPAGVTVGENDRKLINAMESGFEAYRKLGATKMTSSGVNPIEINQDHCVAKVQWSGDYDTPKTGPVTIDFEVTYLMERRDGKLKVFGWVTGDEQAAFRERGLL